MQVIIYEKIRNIKYRDRFLYLNFNVAKKFSKSYVDDRLRFN